MSLAGKSLISITDYTQKEWLSVLSRAKQFETKSPGAILSGKLIACLFFEPSTRTRLSFEAAVQRLGGTVIGFDQAGSSSISKGESLKDTVRTVSGYADLIVIRHPLEGSARLAAEYASVPVINAGDGSNQHPTQTLLDLYSIKKTQATLQGLTVGFLADLKYSRTVHSLVYALSHFNTSFVFVSPTNLKIPDNIRYLLHEKGIQFRETSNVLEAIPVCDILYANRVQKERFAEAIEYEKVKHSLRLSRSMLGDAKPNLKILNPLPRVNEIDEDVDSDPRAYYFTQSGGGVYIRQALVADILEVAI